MVLCPRPVRLAVFVVLLSGLLPVGGHAQTSQAPPRGRSPESVGSLAGVAGLAVRVDELGEAAVRDGLTADDLQQAVEIQLRGARATVDPTAPTTLRITVETYERAELPGVVTYCIMVSVQQPVTLDRDPTLRMPDASTWNANSVGTVGANNLAAGLRNSVRNHVIRFLNDYDTANGRL